MDKTKSFFINVLWKPFFAAIMTASLCKATELPEILIGVAIGVAASVGCYFDIKNTCHVKTTKWEESR